MLPRNCAWVVGGLLPIEGIVNGPCTQSLGGVKEERGRWGGEHGGRWCYYGTVLSPQLEAVAFALCPSPGVSVSLLPPPSLAVIGIRNNTLHQLWVSHLSLFCHTAFLQDYYLLIQ